MRIKLLSTNDAMNGKLTLQIAQRYLNGEHIDLESFTRVEKRALELLTSRLSNFSFLTHLDGSEAEILATACDELILDGLSTIDDESARVLAEKHMGSLSLRGLTSLSKAAAKSLSLHKGLINGMKSGAFVTQMRTRSSTKADETVAPIQTVGMSSTQAASTVDYMKYFIQGADKMEYGPVSLDQIQQWIAENRINRSSLVRPEGYTHWTALGDFPELSQKPKVVAPIPTVAAVPVQSTSAAGSREVPIRISRLLKCDRTMLFFWYLSFCFCIMSPVIIVSHRIEEIKKPYIKTAVGDIVFDGLLIVGSIALGIVSGIPLRCPKCRKKWARLGIADRVLSERSQIESVERTDVDIVKDRDGLKIGTIERKREELAEVTYKETEHTYTCKFCDHEWTGSSTDRYVSR